ncbi:hypothetical protein D3C72_1289760 [compost metagenome]
MTNAIIADAIPTGDTSRVPPTGPYKNPAMAVRGEAGTKATVASRKTSAYKALPVPPIERKASTHWVADCMITSITPSTPRTPIGLR